MDYQAVECNSVDAVGHADHCPQHLWQQQQKQQSMTPSVAFVAIDEPLKVSVF
jgi:hypothetical protein